MKEAASTVLKDATADNVPMLITALGFADDDLRQIASEGLVKIGEPAVASLLALLIGDDDQRVQAADAILAEMGKRAIPCLVGSLDNTALGQKAAAFVIKVGEPALPVLFQKLSEPDCTNQDTIVDMMCTIAGTDRLTLAQAQYRKQIRFLIPLTTKQKVILGIFGREGSFEELMSLQDADEEPINQYPPEDWLPDPAHALLQLRAMAYIAPEFALPHYWLGQWYLLRLQDIEKAIRAFEQATQSQEYVYEHRKAKSYWWLGACYSAPPPYFDYEKSLNCFQQAIELGWDDQLIYCAIQKCAGDMMDLCAEEGKNPQLFLQAAREKMKALSAWLERDPDNEKLRQGLEHNKEVHDQCENMYAQLGEVAAFAKQRSTLLVHRASALGEAESS